MSDRSGFYINGAWVASTGTKTMDIINPATEDAIGSLTLGTASDVDKAVAAARAAFPAFAAMPLADRIDLIKKICDVYKTRFGDIGEAISNEMGAPLPFASKIQAGAGYVHFTEILKVLEHYHFENDVKGARVVREPVGVVGMITPWNWPMNQMTCKIAPALAAGCTMVLKPSEMTPTSAIIMTEILDEAGVPAGVFNMVQGEGPVVGAAMSSHPDIDMMSFTGSTRAGIAVAQAAAPTVKRVAQELGGKSPNVLLDDVDFADAVKRGVRNCFSNSGQSCNAPTRMLVPQGRMDEVLDIARATAEKTKVGDPRAEGTHLGPVVNRSQWDKIQGLIQSGIDEGATLAAGGTGLPEGLNRGFYVKPTVFGNVTPDMTIFREEVFGPVLAITGYSDEEDAVRLANDTLYGLAGYVESGSIDRARKFARQIRAGMVHLNGAGSTPAIPFGGYRQSGNGREWGEHGLDEFFEIKAIIGYEAA